MRLPFWVAAGLSLTNAIYGFFILPESLPLERRSKSAWHMANPLGSLNLLRSHPELFGLALVTALYYLAHQVLPSIFVLYADYRYGWSERPSVCRWRRSASVSAWPPVWSWGHL